MLSTLSPQGKGHRGALVKSGWPKTGLKKQTHGLHETNALESPCLKEYRVNESSF